VTGGPGVKAGAIRDLLGARRYDVVHFHNVSLLGPRVLAMVPPGPVALYTAHEQWLLCPTHVLWKFGRRPCERPQCVPCTLRAGRPPQLWRYTGLLARACRRIDAFLAPSRTVAALHAARGFPFPMAHLPNFAARADDDWRRPPPRPHPRPYFLYAGRLEAIKGVHTLVDAWPAVTGCDLLIAGTGTLADALRRRAGDDPRVRFLGAVPPEHLGPLYAHALGCLVPSLGHEVFPLVVLEALSRKVPVVARDFGALGEVVAESEGGLLYRDEPGLLAALARLATEPGLRADLGERGYRTFLARWTAEAHLERYLALIDERARVRRGTAAVDAAPTGA
jgi:glycosyltransferase involved in cell wall biosynthesis